MPKEDDLTTIIEDAAGYSKLVDIGRKLYNRFFYNKNLLLIQQGEDFLSTLQFLQDLWLVGN